MIPSADLRRLAIALTPAAAGWVVLIITAVAGHSVIRAVAVFAFVLVGPGVAVVRLLPIRDVLERGVLVLALGLSLALLTAEATAISHILRPAVVLVVLILICSAAALTELAMKGGRSS